MKRWDEFLKEQPSPELRAATEAKVFAEMDKARTGRRWWLQLAGVSVAVAAMFGGYSLLRSRPDSSETDLLELADDETLDLDSLEDLDVIELLEELEQWQNG